MLASHSSQQSARVVENINYKTLEAKIELSIYIELPGSQLESGAPSVSRGTRPQPRLTIILTIAGISRKNHT